MLYSLRLLLIVVAAALVVFALAKPVCLRFMSEEDFSRRRNTWLVLTAAGFMAPNFWAFVGIALPVLFWVGRKDSNPVAVYLMMMHVMPPYGVQLPAILVNQLFELNMYRMLGLVVLLPAAFDLMSRADRERPAAVATMDRLLLAYAALILLLAMPYESMTNTMRRAFLLGLDVLLLYFVVSRGCADRRKLGDAIAALILPLAVAVPLALVETLAHYQLYQEIGRKWGVTYLHWAVITRGEVLRAPVFAGHALALGYLMAMGFALWLHLRSHVESKALGLVGAAWMWAGLAATLSRGPMLVAVAAYFTYMAVARRGAARFVKPLLVAALLAGLVLASPIGDALVDMLPFIGTVDAENVVYRQRLAEVSWYLIQENPFFGDPLFMGNLEELRQGQGIIDLVNVYAAVALQSGIVGLALFLGPFLAGLWSVLRLVRETVATDPVRTDLGAGLTAGMVGTLLMMVTGSFGTAVEQLFYALMGLAAAFVAMHAIPHAMRRPDGRGGQRQQTPGHDRPPVCAAATRRELA